MRHLIIVLISLFSVFEVVAQNLEKMSTSQRDKYLIELSTEIIKKFGPGYYRNITPVISEGVFESNDNRPEVKKHIGREYYEIVFPYDKSKEVLECDYAAKIRIWKSDGEPCDVIFGNGYGKNFLFLSYREQTAARAIIEEIPYQQVDTIVEDIWLKE